MKSQDKEIDEILDRFQVGRDTDFHIDICYGRTKEETKQSILSLKKRWQDEAKVKALETMYAKLIAVCDDEVIVKWLQQNIGMQINQLKR